jgi:hypothetical protein
MGSRTPKLPEEMPPNMQSPRFYDPSISDRLNQLAAAAWATEQDLALGSARRTRIQKALRVIEQCLDEREEFRGEEIERIEEIKESRIQKTAESSGDALPELDEEQLYTIHENLRATVESMRLRQQEQRHLNQLSLRRLESVAQTCVVQQNQLKERTEEVQSLGLENRKLGEENDALQDRVADLESQATQRDVAVNAMSSAVAGLEGWINSSPATHLNGQQTGHPRQKSGRYVVRGKGRFRSRYYIDDGEDQTKTFGFGGAPDARELHDGVRAWLRGFRDVEEELQRATPSKSRTSDTLKADLASTDDEWGDFEMVSETQ